MTTSSNRTSTNLDAACSAVSTELGRTDNKAALLFAFDGAVIAGLVSIADKNFPLITQILGVGALAALGTAAVLLLLVVRPNLGGGSTIREGFPKWARQDEEALLASMSEDTRSAFIKTLSTLAIRKFELLARAVDALLIALALLASAALPVLALRAATALEVTA